MLVQHIAFLLIIVGVEVLFDVLEILNVRHGERTVEERSEWVADVLGVDDTESLTDYHRVKTGMNQLQSVVMIGTTLLILYSGLFADAVAAAQGLGLPELAEGVVFLVGTAVVVQIITWPFDAVDTFVVEEVFGFNQQTPRLWIRDTLVGLVVSMILGSVLAAVLLWIVRTFPTVWAFGGAVLFLAFSLVMQVVYPRVIAPLFYDFDPIEEGELRDAVEDVFDRAGFTCDQVYQMDASRRSSHSNAYFTGFGRTKRVVLFDTLVDQMELDEVESVLAHELAHWKRKHIWKLLAADAVQIGLLLVVAQVLMNTDWLYAMFGVPETAYAGLMLAFLWLQPLNQLAQPLTNKLSLAYEREADSFAVEVMGEDAALTDALANLISENLVNPFPHPWYAAFHYTHPPVPDRIRYIEEMGEVTTGGGDGEAAAD